MPKENTPSSFSFIYWLAYYNLASPSVRYRGQYPLKYLHQNHSIESQLTLPSYQPAKALQFARYYLSALLFPKAKQYFNNGVPVLSSDVPENNTFINNGFLCKIPPNFRQRIIDIQAMNDQEYWELSLNARKSIHNFDLQNYCSILTNIIPIQASAAKPLTVPQTVPQEANR